MCLRRRVAEQHLHGLHRLGQLEHEAFLVQHAIIDPLRADRSTGIGAQLGRIDPSGREIDDARHGRRPGHLRAIPVLGQHQAGILGVEPRIPLEHRVGQCLGIDVARDYLVVQVGAHVGVLGLDDVDTDQIALVGDVDARIQQAVVGRDHQVVGDQPLGGRIGDPQHVVTVAAVAVQGTAGAGQ